MKRTQSEDREVGNPVLSFSFLSQSSPPSQPQTYISFNSLLCQAQNGQRAISASTDYLNKKSKDFMVSRKCQLVNRSPLCQVRNNPLGLAEPSVKRDGYAVGSREGSMYRRYLQDTHSAF